LTAARGRIECTPKETKDVSESPEKTEKKDASAGSEPPPKDVTAAVAEANADEAPREVLASAAPPALTGAGDAGDDAGDAGDDAGDDEQGGGAGDATPEAIARRVAAFGEEDESERMARQEERKLAERRAKTKKGKKGGLEAAASKRLAKIAEKAQPKKMIATAVDGADPLLHQTARLTSWAKKNQKAVAAVVGAGVLAVGILAGNDHFQQKKEAEASAELAKGVAAERGRIGEPGKDADEPTMGAKDTRPLFKTAEERRETAIKTLKDVEARFPGTGAAILARLSEGSLQLDARNADLAIAAFDDVKASPLAQNDAEVRGRALEGLGFAYELKGNADDALKAYRELENTVDVLGFKELALYHQARVYEGKGDKDKAKELLKTVHERINKPGENYPFPYLKDVADDRLRALDPTAVPPKPPAFGGPGGGGGNEEQIRKLIEQLQKRGQGQPGKAP
jgi:tetratricopeptide (TPR) repeat protein